MTLYLKYRPRNLDELDLTEVSESLKKIVASYLMKSGDIPHAFLFAGPKGTGKTSAARILAKIINCENLSSDGKPCDKCDQCVSITKGTNLDVIEMDAASHRGIDDVRTLRDAVKLAPTASKKKIYIIDEAHMLTTEASNALLKTLEEPPEHVIFILATTNPEKLIDTIRSRVTYIPFRKATESEIVRSLKRAVEGEKIKINEGALGVIAHVSGGAFRDAVKILEQLVAEERELTKEFLEEHLLSKKSFDLDKFISLIINKDAKSLLQEIESLTAKGVSVEGFLTALISELRLGLLNKVGIESLQPAESLKNLDQAELIELLELFSDASAKISDSPIEELPLEIAIIKWCEEEEGRSQFTRLKQSSPAADNSTGHDNSPSATFVDRDLAQTIASGAHELSHDLGGEKSEVGEEVGVNDEAWKMILSLIKPVNASIEALLRAARPIGYDGKTLTLGVFYKFHKERLEDIHHRKVLEDVVAQVLKSPTRISCTLVEPPPKKIIEETKSSNVLTEGKDQDIIKVAEEIFGN